jgi:hypothetical protein
MERPRDSRPQPLSSCDCYLCGAYAVYSIELSGEDERLELALACEKHARGHIHVAIVLPEHMSEEAPRPL